MARGHGDLAQPWGRQIRDSGASRQNWAKIESLRAAMSGGQVFCPTLCSVRDQGHAALHDHLHCLVQMAPFMLLFVLAFPQTEGVVQPCHAGNSVPDLLLASMEVGSLRMRARARARASFHMHHRHRPHMHHRHRPHMHHRHAITDSFNNVRQNRQTFITSRFVSMC